MVFFYHGEYQYNNNRKKNLTDLTQNDSIEKC